MAVAMIDRPSWPYRPVRGRAQVTDTWTYLASAWIAVILLGL
jgi:hypothetical protein